LLNVGIPEAAARECLHRVYSVEKLSARLRVKNRSAVESLKFPWFEGTAALDDFRPQSFSVGRTSCFPQIFGCISIKPKNRLCTEMEFFNRIGRHATHGPGLTTTDPTRPTPVLCLVKIAAVKQTFITCGKLTPTREAQPQHRKCTIMIGTVGRVKSRRFCRLIVS